MTEGRLKAAYIFVSAAASLLCAAVAYMLPIPLLPVPTLEECTGYVGTTPDLQVCADIIRHNMDTVAFYDAWRLTLTETGFGLLVASAIVLALYEGPLLPSVKLPRTTRVLAMAVSMCLLLTLGFVLAVWVAYLGYPVQFLSDPRLAWLLSEVLGSGGQSVIGKGVVTYAAVLAATATLFLCSRLDGRHLLAGIRETTINLVAPFLATFTGLVILFDRREALVHVVALLSWANLGGVPLFTNLSAFVATAAVLLAS